MSHAIVENLKAVARGTGDEFDAAVERLRGHDIQIIEDLIALFEDSVELAVEQAANLGGMSISNMMDVSSRSMEMAHRLGVGDHVDSLRSYFEGYVDEDEDEESAEL